MSVDFKEMFDASQKKTDNKEKIQLSSDEAQKFKKAFDDPEFRKLFGDYLEEMQNPENRSETEAYITQLEHENKVPVGKELIRPSAGFVAKTKKTGPTSSDDKVFINIVTCDKIKAPSKTSNDKGDAWSLPYSLGPPHMEKDKSGSNAVAFDCCFHTDIMSQCLDTRFQDVVVRTAIEGIEEYYKRANQKVTVHGDFHIVKGIAYKNGDVPSMLIATENKKSWNEDNNVSQPVTSKDKILAVMPPATSSATAPPVIKKGFLLGCNNKTSASTASKNEKPKVSSSLIQELSSSIIDDKAPTHPLPTKHIPSTSSVSSTSTSGPVAPLYIMSERGKVGLGDFEAMKSHTVTITRPADIIYRIHLPLAEKASMIVLDIAEKSLSLKYMMVYELSLQLPYPVYDKKGTAKYDKASKSLVVTLPVKPIDVTSLPPPPSTAVVDETSILDEAASTAIDTPSLSSSSSDAKKEHHSRWIQPDTSSEHDDSKKLALKIKEESLQAQLDYNTQRVEPPVPIPPPTTTLELLPETSSDANDASFIASASYIGYKTGYIFQMGKLGLGYYHDPKHHTTSSSSSNASSLSHIDADVIQDASFKYRQTEQSLSLIINVPHIIAGSVMVSYHDRGIDIIFRALNIVHHHDKHKRAYHSYALGYEFIADINTSQCSYDVSEQNIAIRMSKHEKNMILWNDAIDARMMTMRPYDGDVVAYMGMIFSSSSEDRSKSLDQPYHACSSSSSSTYEKASTNRTSKSQDDGDKKSNAATASIDKHMIKDTINAMAFTSNTGALFDLD